ncbi:hypothetical protein BsIDN1_27800 [Bacillus safensis]|uniref:Uncharacterized protein n=1 Tax=Bacillus safensis TaxID=561879 RepID=A0A5S9M996_BACIA|nr:hypothetical protein BsIDN1_27800 [Bacillus safensis]
MLGWKKIALDQYRMKLTDFLDPREQFITESVIQHGEELGIMFFLAGMRERSAKEPSFILII